MKAEWTANFHGKLIFSTRFFQDIFQQQSPDIEVISAQYAESSAENLALEVRHSDSQMTHPIGISRYQLEVKEQRKRRQLNVLVKSKSRASVFISTLADILVKGSAPLPAADIARFLQQQSFACAERREVNCYRLQSQFPVLQSAMPHLYGSLLDDENNLYITIQEYLDRAVFARSTTDRSIWSSENIRHILPQLAMVHDCWLGSRSLESDYPWLFPCLDTKTRIAQEPLWRAYAKAIQPIVSPDLFLRHMTLIDDIPQWSLLMSQMPQTIIYNDLSLKNCALDIHQQERTLKLFDWEMCTPHIPQRDLIELLSYFLDPDFSETLFLNYLEIYYQATIQLKPNQSQWQEWLSACVYACYDYLIDRVSFYLIVEYVESRNALQLWQNTWRMVDILKKHSL